MAGIQLSGLVPGLDTQSIITQLMAVERHPRTRITGEQAQATKRQSLLQDINAKLTTLKTATDDLKSVSTWLDTQSVTSADETKVTVARTAGAAPGGYDVAIAQMAAAARRTFTFASPATAGNLQIFESDGTTLRSSIPLAAGATVNDAVAAINSDTKANLYAVNVNGDLVMAAKTTGVASGFTASGAGVGAQLQSVPGQDSDIFINGIEYKRSSNVITDALPGVQLTLKGKTAAGATVGVTVGAPGPDKDLVVGKVKAFVDAYNALVTTTRADLDEKRVPKATTTAQLQQGTLFGDTGLSGMLTALRSSVAAAIPGLTGLTSLNDVGVSTGAANTGSAINQDSVDGKLTFDTVKFKAALDANPNGVRQLLGGQTGVTGFAQTFGGVLSPFQGTGGVLDSRLTSVTSDLTRIADKLDKFDARMDVKQSQYQKRFTALETALSNAQAAGSKLSSYFPTSTTTG
jgi:flagellar hook-associated protein 2